MTLSNYRSLPLFLKHFLSTYGDKPAFTENNRTLTFSEVDLYSDRLAIWLQQQGFLAKGDRVAIQLPNILQNPISVYGVLKANLTVVNTNPLYTEREMTHQFNDSGAKVLIIHGSLYQKFKNIEQDVSIEKVILVSDTDFEYGGLEYGGVNNIGFKSIITSEYTSEVSYSDESMLDTTCILQYTGGTTGLSKGAALTHSNVLDNSQQMLGVFEHAVGNGRETVLCPLPLYHIYAFTVCLLAYASIGSHTVLVANPKDPDNFVNAFKNNEISIFAGINTLFVALSNYPPFQALEFSKLKLTLSGGTALTLSAFEGWKALTGVTITEGYGLSETSPVLTFNVPGKEVFGTVGLPLAQTDIKLLDQNGCEVEPGKEGEICAKGPQVMAGYWNKPEETNKAFTDSGYFKTGDVGIRLDSGHIKIVDRIKDLILVSGFNVYPNEIEEVLTSYDHVLEAAVVGMADDKTGEKVVAYITVAKQIDLDDLRRYCAEKLTPYKMPKEINILPELPKSTVGKILRRELRQAGL